MLTSTLTCTLVVKGSPKALNQFKRELNAPPYVHVADSIAWLAIFWLTTLEESPTSVTYEFSTFGPPIALVQDLGAEFPELRLVLNYMSERDSTVGRLVVVNDKWISEDRSSEFREGNTMDFTADTDAL